MLALLLMALVGPIEYLAGVLVCGLALFHFPYARLGVIYGGLALCAGAAAYLAFRRDRLLVRLLAGGALLLNMAAVVTVAAIWSGEIERRTEEIKNPVVEPGRVGVLIASPGQSAEAVTAAHDLAKNLQRTFTHVGLGPYITVRCVPPLFSEEQAKRLGREKMAHIVIWYEGPTLDLPSGAYHVTVLGANETDVAIEPQSLMRFVTTQDTVTLPGPVDARIGDTPLLEVAGSIATGFACLAVGRPQLAAAQFQRLIQKGSLADVTLTSLYTHFGTTLLYLERPDLALEQMQLSNGVKPNARAWVGIGNARLALRDWLAASQAYEQAMALDPYDPIPYCGVGIIYARLRDVRQAIYSYEQALALAPTLGVAHALLGLSYELLGEAEAAHDAYVSCASHAGPNAGLLVAALDRADQVVRYPPTPVPTATPRPIPTPTPIPTAALYRVEKGDTLQVIAAKFDVPVDDIVELNKLADPNAIYIGQELMIPQKKR